MSHVLLVSRLRVLAVTTALALALAGAIVAWGPAAASDGTATPMTSGCATASATKGAPAATPVADANCVEVDTHDIYFSANLITIPSNTDVTFLLHNEGAAAHSFDITDHNNKDVKNLNITESLNPGDQKEITINAPAGTYYFWCDVPGHEEAGMWGHPQG